MPATIWVRFRWLSSFIAVLALLSWRASALPMAFQKLREEEPTANTLDSFGNAAPDSGSLVIPETVDSDEDEGAETSSGGLEAEPALHPAGVGIEVTEEHDARAERKLNWADNVIGSLQSWDPMQMRRTKEATVVGIANATSGDSLGGNASLSTLRARLS